MESKNYGLECLGCLPAKHFAKESSNFSDEFSGFSFRVFEERGLKKWSEYSPTLSSSFSSKNHCKSSKIHRISPIFLPNSSLSTILLSLACLVGRKRCRRKAEMEEKLSSVSFLVQRSDTMNIAEGFLDVPSSLHIKNTAGSAINQ